MERIGNIVEGLIARMNAASFEFENSELVDGIPHCKSCGDPLVGTVKLEHGSMRVPIVCSCQKREQEVLVQREEQRRLERKIQALREEGMLDKSYLKSRFEDDDSPNSFEGRVARKYCRVFGQMDGKGLLFMGTPGNGKSFYAGCIANELINRQKFVIITNLSTLVDRMMVDYGAYKQDVLQKVTDCDLLILDDLGVERSTPAAYEKVFDIIDTRYRAGKPLIVTTNLTGEDINNPLDNRYMRIYDRIKEMCIPIKFTGQSRRGARDDMKVYTELLFGSD